MSLLENESQIQNSRTKYVRKNGNFEANIKDGWEGDFTQLAWKGDADIGEFFMEAPKTIKAASTVKRKTGAENPLQNVSTTIKIVQKICPSFSASLMYDPA